MLHVPLTHLADFQSDVRVSYHVQAQKEPLGSCRDNELTQLGSCSQPYRGLVGPPIEIHILGNLQLIRLGF